MLSSWLHGTSQERHGKRAVGPITSPTPDRHRLTNLRRLRLIPVNVPSLPCRRQRTFRSVRSHVTERVSVVTQSRPEQGSEVNEIRRIALIAVFSDDEVMQRVVLKGGNALNLVYGLGSRASIDLDFSIDGDFHDVEDVKVRLFRAIESRFHANGYLAFDLGFEHRPPRPDPERLKGNWGGYRVTFKVIRRIEADRLGGRLDRLRRTSIVVGPAQVRTFRIEFSKHEFFGEKQSTELGSFQIFVYSPAMLVIEKLRALCQQHPDYPHRLNARPRARDFYDIHELVSAYGIDVTTDGNVELLRSCFAAKEVPLNLLSAIDEQRDFHRDEWPAVVASVARDVHDFDYYASFLRSVIGKLQALGIVEPPNRIIGPPRDPM